MKVSWTNHPLTHTKKKILYKFGWKNLSTYLGCNNVTILQLFFTFYPLPNCHKLRAQIDQPANIVICLKTNKNDMSWRETDTKEPTNYGEGEEIRLQNLTLGIKWAISVKIIYSALFSAVAGVIGIPILSL